MTTARLLVARLYLGTALVVTLVTETRGAFVPGSFFTPKTFVKTGRSTVMWESSSLPPEEQEEEPKLVLGEELEGEMSKVQSKYPTSEAAYLEAARKRAEEARASQNAGASDEDWNEMAASKQQSPGKEEFGWDGWSDEGAIQAKEDEIFLVEDSGEGGEDDEPKLLLF